jgi:acetyl esterase/lipase
LAAALPWAAASAHAAAPAEARTSKNDGPLKKILDRFPQADTDKDGVLTAAEVQAFRPKFEELRRKMLQRQRAVAANRPQPSRANVKYGPHERNVFDLWLPEGAAPDKPLPVFVYFHGGGFVGGDKSKLNPAPYLNMGYAVVSSNYRFINGRDIVTPIPMQDCARAIQFLRHKAGDFGIDPERVAVSGGSAGAVITMWIAYKDDMADPRSDDPVSRQSTRVTCIVPVAGPTNLDPEWIRKNLGGPPEIHSSMPKFYGVDDGDYSGPEVRKLIEESSAVNHATADDPPTYLIYGGALDNLPLPRDASQGLLIHHPYFGKVLKDKLDDLGVECEFRYGARREQTEVRDFLAKHLGRN